MSTFLPKEVQEGLDAARAKDLARKARYRVEQDGKYFKILKLRDNGFSVDVEQAEQLRGLVDIFDGARHLYQCLIVASSEENGHMWYEYKRSTIANDKAPLDFYREPDAPVGYLTDER